MSEQPTARRSASTRRAHADPGSSDDAEPARRTRVAVVEAATTVDDAPTTVDDAPTTDVAPTTVGDAPTTDDAPTPSAAMRRPRVRRVTRVIRHIDTWTVFKVALVFHLMLYVSALVSGVLLWNVAHGTGTVDNVERFMESFGWESFQFDGSQMFDSAWRIGLFLVVGLTGLAVLAATTFNLITDVVGGVRVTVLEEEVIAVPRSPGLRPGSRRSPATRRRRAEGPGPVEPTRPDR